MNENVAGGRCWIASASAGRQKSVALSWTSPSHLYSTWLSHLYATCVSFASLSSSMTSSMTSTITFPRFRSVPSRCRSTRWRHLDRDFLFRLPRKPTVTTLSTSGCYGRRLWAKSSARLRSGKVALLPVGDVRWRSADWPVPGAECQLRPRVGCRTSCIGDGQWRRTASTHGTPWVTTHFDTRHTLTSSSSSLTPTITRRCSSGPSTTREWPKTATSVRSWFVSVLETKTRTTTEKSSTRCSKPHR